MGLDTGDVGNVRPRFACAGDVGNVGDVGDDKLLILSASELESVLVRTHQKVTGLPVRAPCTSIIVNTCVSALVRTHRKVNGLPIKAPCTSIGGADRHHECFCLM